MTFSDPLSIGPVSLPVGLVYAGGVVLTAYLSGLLFLHRYRDDQKEYSEILSSLLLPFLLGWKLSPILTDFADVMAHPSLLLFSSGSRLNLLIGLSIAGLRLTWKLIKTDPAPRTRKALLPALLLVLAGTALSTAVFRSGDGTGENSLPAALLHSEDGETWNPENANGQPTVLNIWASWCPPCKAEMPLLDSMASDERYSDVNFFAVNAAATEKSPDAGRNWLAMNGYTIPLLVDRSGAAMNAWKISSLPTTIILNSQGKISSVKTGAVSRSWLRSEIRKARKE